MPVRQHLARAARGFTLIELLVVISIIMFLATILVVAAMGFHKKAKIQATQARLGNLSQALNDYYQTFQAFPPSAYPGAETAGSEWWRHLSFSGTAFQRPQKSDGSIVAEPFIPESRLGLLQDTGGVRAPRDAFGSDILYVYPADNELLNLTPGGPPDPTIPAQIQVVQLYYHCIVLSVGEDKVLGGGVGGITPLGTANPDVWEGLNQDTVQHQLIRTVSGQ